MADMLVLLPPSESKATRPRGAVMDPLGLSFPELTVARLELAEILAEVSARPDACDVLGVPRSLSHEVARNTRLATAHALTASRLYTGVLYDALDMPTLDPASRRRASRRVVISSALYGALRLGDRVAPYRLSMDATVPGIGRLAPYWREPLASAMANTAGDKVVVDCRSATYATAWTPQGEAAERWVQVKVPGASHMAKHTRGLVARAVCQAAHPPASPADLPQMLGDAFSAEITPPAKAGKPWVLSVLQRP